MTVAADTLAQPLAHAVRVVVRVLFFGRVADVCGRSIEVPLPPEGCSLEALRARIADLRDGAAEALGEPCIRIAIDQLMVSGDPWVSPGQEVAFLSAFSGG